MKTLNLSTDLKLPQDVVTEALAWIGARGSGKTHGAGKLAECFYAAGIPFVWLDPVGVAYGLRLARDGKGAGLKVPVFGGLHGDILLEPTAGALLADLIVDKNLSAILDVSQFDTDAQKAKFTSDFTARLFTRKKKDPSVLHLFIDEGQEFVPQNPQPGEQMMLHNIQRYIKIGRNFGLGVSILSPRPQEISKKALNACQTVLAFRLTGPQERKAMKDWIAAHDIDQSVIEKLPSLETGNCHVWSPAFLKISKEIRILPKETFDASATPKFGERRAARELAPIDIAQLKEAMAATVEKEKSENPKFLRARIAELERSKTTAPAPARVEVPVLAEALVKRLEDAQGRAAQHIRNLEALAASMAKAAAEIAASIVKRTTPAPTIPKSTLPRTARPAAQPPSSGNSSLAPAHKRVINALATLEKMGVEMGHRTQVSFMAKMKLAGGYGQRIVGELKSGGLLEYPPIAGTLRLTDAGRSQADASDGPQTTEEMQELVKSMVGPAHQKILTALIAAYPNARSRDELGAEVGFNLAGGYGQRVVGELKTLGAVEYSGPGQVKAADLLFLTTH